MGTRFADGAWRYIAETICNRPVFVTNCPKHIKSFYMKQNDDGRTVAATDLLVPEWARL